MATRPVPPAPEEPRPLRADARRNRDAIVESARAVFAECGADAPMDVIAARAGLGIGTVYRHFKDKDALLGELVRRHFETLAERAEAWAERDVDPWKAFSGFVRTSAEAMAGDAAQQRVMWTLTTEGFELAAGARRRLVVAVTRLIRAAQESGAMRADFAPSDMPTMMCGLGSAMQAIDPETGAPRDWRRLLEYLLDGLRRVPG